MRSCSGSRLGQSKGLGGDIKSWQGLEAKPFTALDSLRSAVLWIDYKNWLRRENGPKSCKIFVGILSVL